jgi:hypothetical protein
MIQLVMETFERESQNCDRNIYRSHTEYVQRCLSICIIIIISSSSSSSLISSSNFTFYWLSSLKKKFSYYSYLILEDFTAKQFPLSTCVTGCALKRERYISIRNNSELMSILGYFPSSVNF